MCEITRVGEGGRSVLFTPDKDGEEDSGDGVEEGYVSRDAQLHVVTPVDVMFLVLPVLAPAGKKGEKKVFQPLDDILDDVLDFEDALSRNLRDILLHPKFRATVERKMVAVCDMVEAGETMFRISEEKLVGELLAKAQRMVKAGLPASMEERFVRRELEIPVLSISREEEMKDVPSQSQSQPQSATRDSETEEEVLVQMTESQESNASSSSSSSTTVTETQPSPGTPITPPDVSQKDATDLKILHLLRLRTALSFLLSSYIPTHLTTKIEATLSSPSSPQDFIPLTAHLAHIASLRAKAHESRALYNNASRKRGFEEEEDAAVARAEKKRREEEEKKKKANESRGVRELKKVNTSGMKKLSAFFGKAAPKK